MKKTRSFDISELIKSAAVCLLLTSAGWAVQKPQHVRAIYLTAPTIASKRMSTLIEMLSKHRGNAVVMDVELAEGKLAFRPQNARLREANPGSSLFKNIENTIAELHSRNIYVIARQVVNNDPYVISRKPEWRIKKRSGGYYDKVWLDPSHPAIQNYNLLMMAEVANLGFDEIQLDYIRFPATNHGKLDYHFDESSTERHQIISAFLSKARKVADDHRVKLGVDVFGAIVWGDIDWRNVGQRLADIAERVDVIYPMTYPSHYSAGFGGYNDLHNAPYAIVHDSIARFVKGVNGQAEIRPWIQGFPMKVRNFGPTYIKDQIRAGYDAGGKGFAIWNSRSSYTQSWTNMGLTPQN